ncbi:MAG TPA: CBS domain-containing protein [Candidatus Nitrosopolaris sp.]|nr:CBS domain-containing protein [Candidatus Nitrosopolaris sp.]
MKKKLETIKQMASVQQAAQKMKEKNVSSLVVVDEVGKPQGIVTERDLATKICINNVLANAVTNNEIMSSPLLTISGDSSPSIAADMMLQHNIRHILVVDKNDVTNARAIGIVTPLDFTRFHELTNENVDTHSIEEILKEYRQIY